VFDIELGGWRVLFGIEGFDSLQRHEVGLVIVLAGVQPVEALEVAGLCALLVRTAMQPSNLIGYIVTLNTLMTCDFKEVC
jgi:hypothetical protein